MFYEKLESSAIFSIKTEDSRVFVVYNSNIDKEYVFKCEDTQEFDNNVSKTLQNKESLGKLVHKTIKEGKMVEISETKSQFSTSTPQPRWSN